MAGRDTELIPTRATLLNRLKDWQNQASWQEFFDTYWALIFGVATKYGLTRSESEDVVQEVMVEVARHMPGFKYDPAKGSFKAWLLNLTRWRIADHFRKGRRAPLQGPMARDTARVRLENIEDSRQVPPDLEKLWDTEWEKSLLDAATAKVRRRLDPKQYQIFDCSVNRGWPTEKVCKTLGLSANLVYVAKHRVTEAIRIEFNRLEREII